MFQTVTQEAPSFGQRRADIYGDLAITAEGELLRKCLAHSGSYVQDQIDSYDKYISAELSAQLSARPLEVRGSILASKVLKSQFNMPFEPRNCDLRLYFTEAIMSKPEYIYDRARRDLYPENTRRKGMSYLGAVSSRPQLYAVSGSYTTRVPVNRPYQNTMSIPVMTGSEYCHLSSLRDPVDFLRYGEDPYDAFGNFIINGKERIIINIEKLRTNRIYVFPPAHAGKEKPYCRITVPTPVGTKQMQLIVINKSNVKDITSNSPMLDPRVKNPDTIELQLGIFRKDDKRKTSNSVNIIHVIDILDELFPTYDAQGQKLPSLQAYSDQYNSVLPPKRRDPGNIPIYKAMLRQLIPPNEWKRVVSLLPATEADYASKSVVQVKQLICSWLGLSEKTSTLAEQNYKLWTVFREQFFPNIPTTRTYDKIMMLVAMSARLLRFMAGYTRPSDKDSWANKQLASGGKTTAQLVRCLWRNTIVEAQNRIDANKSLVGDLPAETIMTRMLAAVTLDPINEKIITAFNSSNHGAKETFARQNITDPLDVNNIIDSMSLKTKIDVHIDRNVKSASIRAVQPTQYGYVDPAKTPDDTGCGIIKNKACTSITTVDIRPEPMVALLKPIEGTAPTAEMIASGQGPLHPDLLLVNGCPEGWCNTESLYRRCVGLRRLGIIDRHTELVRTPHRTFEIYTDAGRLVRPLMVVGPSGRILIDELGLREADFGTMLVNGCVDYVGSAEAEYVTIAATTEILKSRLETIEAENANISSLEAELAVESIPRPDISREEQKRRIGSLEARLSQAIRAREQTLKPYDYVEIHPIAVMGIAAALMPFMNTNQACRVSYQAKMHGQAMSIERSNPHLHLGTTRSMAFPTMPLVQTSLDTTYGLPAHPIGVNTTVMVAAYGGYNQEDAVVVNKAFIDLGGLLYVKTFTYETNVVTVGGIRQSLERPQIHSGDDEQRYRFINENGLPSIGAILREGDCVIGKTQISDSGHMRVVNVSEYIKIDDEGVVDDIRVTNDGKGVHVSVRIRSTRAPEIGDKLASRYAQKVTIGRVEADENMPFTLDGTRADFIVNPHAMPSRMTMGYMKEILIGKAMSVTGQVYDSTGFQDYTTEAIGEMLHNNGFRRDGMEVMIDGTTGEEIKANIYLGTVYFQQLTHQARDKIQSRSRGGVNEKTRQAGRGRFQRGGVRFGNMEGWAATHHGAGHFIHERLCSQSDTYTMVICSRCSTVSSYMPAKGAFVCNQCGETGKFGVVKTPYVFKLLIQYMASTGIIMRPIAVPKREYLAKLAEKARLGESTADTEQEQHEEESEEEEIREEDVEMTEAPDVEEEEDYTPFEGLEQTMGDDEDYGDDDYGDDD